MPPSHVAALKQWIEVLMASTTCKDEDSAPNPRESLRMEPSRSPVIVLQEDEFPPLRVDKPSSVQENKKHSCKVHFAPVPSTTMKPTYKNTRGSQGAQHYKHQRALPPNPISQAKTVHPKKSTHCAPTPVTTHCYKTRRKGKLNTPIVSPQIALPGTAVNPDTGKIAEHKRLCLCNEGPL
jgi:hypothetical protein